MKTLEVLTSILVAFITAIFSNQVKDYLLSIRNVKLKRFFSLLERKESLKLIDSNFTSEFIDKDMKEAYFYARTGISTNENSIVSYLEFKNNLKEDFDWIAIKKAKPYLKFDNDNKIIVSITKKDRLKNNIQLIIALIMFITGIACVLTLSNFLKSYNFKRILTIIVMFIVPMIFGYLFLANSSSYFIAKRMEKNLLDNV